MNKSVSYLADTMQTQTTRLTRYSFFFNLIFLVGTPIYAGDQPSPEALEKWFASDDPAPPEIQDVNEGELHFFTTPPDKRVPAMLNEITISPASMETGWVNIKQCHQNLDPINAVEVVYRYHQMRELQIISSERINKAWVEGQSVQLEDVQHGGSLCVSLQARILYPDGESRFALRNGPFERKFLDGYFPLHVMLTVHYPAQQIQFVTCKPKPTAGFELIHSIGQVHIDTWFEGKLLTELTFERH